jgi:AcrR family transcriptional regulator
MPEVLRLRERKQRRTREAIAEAALRLFIEAGFDATSVEQIAAAADVAPRTFYRYFPSKEDVVFVDPAAQETLRRNLAQRRPGESDVALIARAMLAAMSVHEERVRRARMIIEATPPLRARALQMMAETSETIADQLLRGRSRSREARFRASVLAQTVSMIVRVAFFEWIECGRRGAASVQVDRALRLLHDDLCRPGRKS